MCVSLSISHIILTGRFSGVFVFQRFLKDIIMTEIIDDDVVIVSGSGLGNVIDGKYEACSFGGHPHRNSRWYAVRLFFFFAFSERYTTRYTCRIPNHPSIFVKRMELYCFEVIVRIVSGHNGTDVGSSKIRTDLLDTNPTTETRKYRPRRKIGRSSMERCEAKNRLQQ